MRVRGSFPDQMFFPGGPPFIYAERNAAVILDSTCTAPYASHTEVLNAVGIQGIEVCVFGLGDSRLQGVIGDVGIGISAATWRALNTECSPCYTVSAPYGVIDGDCTQDFTN